MSVFLSENEVIENYSAARQNAKIYTQSFDELERIAANRVRSDIPANLPKINDGSLAALLLETPMRVLAEMMTGQVKVEDRDEAWLAELANIVWSEKIIPNANTQAPFETKIRTALYRALIYGAQPVYDFFTINGNYKGADFILPYIKDVALEPGKTSDAASDYIYLDSWYTQLQLKAIIENAEVEEKLAKKDKRESNNPWVISELKKLVDANPTEEKPQDQQTRTERAKAVKTGGIKITTCFQRGIEAPFTSFATTITTKGKQTVEGAVVVRKEKNKNPTGDIPIHFLYAFQDLDNPYGKGQVEISGGTQNTLDYMTQLHVFATQKGLQPPVLIAGDRTQTNLNTFQWGPDQKWLAGAAKVELMDTSDAIYSQFPNSYGLYKTQLLNLQGTSDASVSSESGAPGYSKTDAGVNLQQQRTNAHDNFLRTRVATFLNRLGSSMLNTHFGMMEGSDILRVTEEQATRLMRGGLIDEDPETKKPSTQDVETIWENVRGKFTFEFDAETSIGDQNQKDAEALTNIATSIGENPDIITAMAASGWKLDVGKLYQQLFTKSGLSDVDEIITPLSPEDAINQNVDPNTPMGTIDPNAGITNLPGLEGLSPDIIASLSKGGGAGGPMMPDPSMPIEPPLGPDLNAAAPMAATPEMGATNEDLATEQLLNELMQRHNIDQRTAAIMALAMSQGFGEQEILDFIDNGGQ